MTKISKFFTIDEMVRTSQKFDNTPSEAVIANLTALAQDVLDPIREQFGVTTINSGYRSEAVNKAVGGSKTSQHRTGEAVDFRIDRQNLLTVAHWIKENLPFDQMILEDFWDSKKDAAWIHISYKKTGHNRKQLLTMRRDAKFKPKYSTGLPEL
jgi:hypothetical protein